MKSNEQTQQNSDKYFKILRKYFSDAAIESLERDLGTRISCAPRGISANEGGYPGALVEFALSTAKKIKHITNLTPEQVESLIKVSLLHEIGKVGSDENEQFVYQDSTWHQEKLGQYYKYNEACEKMTFVHRTLYFIAKYSLVLSPDEWIAILTSGGFHLEENRFYGREGHVLSHAFQLCRTMSENELKASASTQVSV